MTDEQRALLEKFGFCLEAGIVKHPKMGIVRKEEEFARCATQEELRAYIRELLQNQCRWKRADSDA